MNTSLIIASSNHGKVKEFRDLLAEFPFNIFAQPDGLEINETGSSFVENARIKALAVSELTGEWALADDSGLCVDALNGAPGIYSARFAQTDLERIKRLLKEMAHFKNRNATFKSAICIADKGKILLEVEESCHGLITNTPRGKEGFGYDPIFEVIELGKTFAEMGIDLKKKFGHRGRAFQSIQPGIKNLLKIS
tara:strand:- start:12 stop:593 length:582 start_codon:yes stop_codon:yes gene_type:complete